MNAATMPQPRSLGPHDRRNARLCRRRHRAWALSAATLVALYLTSPVDAITFTINYTENDTPSFDPDGLELQRIADAATRIWSYYIEDDRNFEFDLSWDDLDGELVGAHKYYAIPFYNTNIVLDTHHSDGTPRDWFFDSTPFENEEFAMGAVLENDLYGTSFIGTPPENLEVGYNGAAHFGALRPGQYDALTTLLHEIGHQLGINYEDDDDDWDLNPAALGGANLSVVSTDGPILDLNHLSLEPALMSPHPQANPNARRLPSAVDILAMWDEGDFTEIDLPRVDFLGGQSTSWDDALNWIGGRVPNDDNEVFVRHGGAVWLSGAHSTADSLVIDLRSSLLMLNDNLLQVFGPVQVGSFSLSAARQGELIVGNFLSGAPRLEAESLSLTKGLLHIVDAEGVVSISGDLLIDAESEVKGEGLIEVGGRLSNDGQISASFGRELTLRTTGNGVLDLDGSVNAGRMSAVNGNLHVEGPLSDAFHGTATIGASRTMRFSHPWQMGGLLVMNGGDASSPATLAGAEMTLGGQVQTDGHAIINTVVVLATDTLWTVEGMLSVNGISETGGPHTFIKNGDGTLVANMSTSGPKNINQGVFQGSINGAGAATIMPGAVFQASGTSGSPISLQGVNNPIGAVSLRVIGPESATLSGQLTIASYPIVSVEPGGRLNLAGGITNNGDGSGFYKHGTGELIVSAPSVGSIPVTVYNGQLTIAHNSALGAGQVNLLDFGSVPVLAIADGITFSNPIGLRRATISGLGNATVGSNISFLGSFSDQGTLHVAEANHKLTFTGNITDNGVPATFTKTGAGVVDLYGNTSIAGGLTVAEGLLANNGVISGGPTNAVAFARLAGSGQFADVNMQDLSLFSPGSNVDLNAFSPAAVSMEDLSFAPSSGLLLQLGGVSPGSGHDQLLVGGNATLAGALIVRLASGFSLSMGQEFVVLDVAGTLNGQFAGLGEDALLGNFGGRELFITYAAGDGNDVALYTGAISVNSDFNDDGLVDGTDLAAWRTNFGVAALADADADGDSDGADFLAWQQQLGGAPASAGADPVPEPAAMALALAGCSLAATRRTTWRRFSRLPGI